MTGQRKAPAPPPTTEAIDKAGPVLFGDDWLGTLSKREHALLEQHGPHRGAGPNEQLIAPCPPHSRNDLDRALGRYHRAGAQRSTVLDWLFQNQVIFDNHGELCINGATLAAALAAVPAGGLMQQAPDETARARGRPLDLRKELAAKMKALLDSGSVTKSEMKRWKPDWMAKHFGHARKTCVDARKLALA